MKVLIAGFFIIVIYAEMALLKYPNKKKKKNQLTKFNVIQLSCNSLFQLCYTTILTYFRKVFFCVLPKIQFLHKMLLL